MNSFYFPFSKAELVQIQTGGISANSKQAELVQIQTGGNSANSNRRK
jgi:hypothetical protein